jgi:hypothetical protein
MKQPQQQSRKTDGSTLTGKEYYLWGYNAVLAFGWLYVSVSILAGVCTEGLLYLSHAFERVGNLVVLLQCLVILDILHILLRAVPLSPVPIWVRVYCKVIGRNHLLLGALIWIPQAQEHWAVGVMLLLWALLDVIRYSFYLLKVLGRAPTWLRTMRYCAFIPQYPISLIFEVMVWWVMFRYMIASDLHAIWIRIPNTEVSIKVFDHFLFAFVNILWAIFVFPYNYYGMWMLAQYKLYGKGKYK